MSFARSPHPLAGDAAYGRLKDWLIGLTGLAYYADKDAELCGHIAERLRQLRLPDCGSYLARLQGPGGEPELDALVERLTIGETFFFRHSELFHALRDVVLPACIRRNEGLRRLRIWSAGCATGAEPYSLAILLQRDLAPLVNGWDLSILGTDINRHFLARAQTGQFEEWALRGMPEDMRRACFVPAEAAVPALPGSNSPKPELQRVTGRSWQIAPQYRQCVSFQYHNLVKHPFPSLLHNLLAFDVILCRNVMIYFSRELLQRLVGQFYDCLADEGWLLVGHAEPNVELFRQFRALNTGGAVLYQKSREAAATLPSIPPVALGTTLSTGKTNVGVQTLACLDSPTAELQRMTGHSVPSVPAWTDPAATQPPIGTSAVIQWALPSVSELPLSSTFPVQNSGPGATSPTASVQNEVHDIRSLADQGKLEEAARRCEGLLTAHRLDPAAHFFSALILEQVGRHGAAQQALRRAIYLDRNYVLAHYYLGLLLQKQQDRPRAVRSFQNVLSIVSTLAAEHPIPDADGLTAGDLANLTRMQLEAMA